MSALVSRDPTKMYVSTEDRLIRGWIRKIITCAAIVFSATQLSIAQQANNAAYFSDGIPDLTTEWVEIDAPKIVPNLQMLADQNKGNLQLVRTWQGTCNVKLRESLSREYVEKRYRNSSGEVVNGSLTKVSTFTVNFAIDLQSGSIYRLKETIARSFKLPASNRPVEVSNVGPVDDSSIVTSEHFLHMSPTVVWPSFGYLPNHPDAQNKRAAFREPVQASTGHQLGDLIDPRNFFGFNSHKQTFGDQLSLYARSMERNGRDAAEMKLSLYKASHSGNIWYRLVKSMGRMGNELMTATSVWGSKDGFNPSMMVLAIDNDDETAIAGMSLRWQLTDGIYLPTYVMQAHFKEDGNLQYQREVELENNVVNEPLDPNQFNFRGLGLQDGELVIDKIENAVFIMKDGEPAKLAEFGTDYEAPPIAGTRVWPIRWMAMAATVFVMLVLIALIFRKRAAEA